MTTWVEWRDRSLAAIGCAGQWRAMRTLDAAGPCGRLVDEERTVVSFASNDYLGLANHPTVVAAAHEALDRWGTGTGASRLIIGSRPIHRDLESALAEWKSTAAALSFPTGYAANVGVLTSLAGPGVTICSDSLNHASIVDGCRLARAQVRVYDHADLDHLSALLSDIEGRVVVVSDSVFSMDGDTADLVGLAQLCARRRALLVLDEAHAVLGPHPDLDRVEHLRVGTLSKTLGSVGGFVAGSRRFDQFPLGHSRNNRAERERGGHDVCRGVRGAQYGRWPSFRPTRALHSGYDRRRHYPDGRGANDGGADAVEGQRRQSRACGTRAQDSVGRA